MKKRVVVGMSGGVDSSVAAYLLLKQGYEVIGITMQIWQDKKEEEVLVEGGCCSLAAVDDARRVANILGIPYYVLNFKGVFKEKVIDYFIDEYMRGRTPNPCIACNKYIKFDELIKKAKSLDAEYVATGHYARIVYDKDLGRYLLKKAADLRKDQTYVLYNLTQEQLKHILLPNGDYTKEEIRRIAKEIGIPVYNKPESQEICFVPDNQYAEFIKENVKEEIKPGYIVDTKGNILGTHKGIIHYTIGQRRGLGISAGKPLYVVDIDTEKNLVIVGENHEIFGSKLLASEVNFLPFDELKEEIYVMAKIRYTAKEAKAKVIPYCKNMVMVEFEEKQRAITPGQAVVFYQEETLIGGGTIVKKVE